MGMTRPGTVVLVAGTATDVGKTWCAARTIEHLRALGLHVAARKPVQSGDGTGPWDSDVLAAASGESVDAVCRPERTYRVAWAPPMAAEALGIPACTVADLAAELSWPAGVDVGFVEGVGGPRSPLAADGDTVTLAHALAPDLVVLVAHAGLGTINDVRLARSVFEPFPTAVLLNRFDTDDELHRRNLAWLVERDHVDVLHTPEALAAFVARRRATA